MSGVGAWVAALAGPLACIAALWIASQALGAQLKVSDSAQLHLIAGGGNNTLKETGKAKGTLPGTVTVSLAIHTYTANSAFTIYTRWGSISGKGIARLKTGKGAYASFGGAVSVTKCTGRYSHASGKGGLYGTINRRDDAMTVAVIGTLRLSASAHAAAKTPKVSFSARFVPDRPGRSTTVYYGFRVSEPQPLRSIELRLPAGMGLAKASLGLAECRPAVLRARGPKGCPSNSFAGHGLALGELLGEERVEERAGVAVVFGPYEQGRPTILFFVEGIYPVSEERVLYGHLLPAARPFGQLLSTEVPLIPSWPGGPDVGITSLHSSIGPRGLHYHYTSHGRRIEFTPRGLYVPESCPAGGYPVQVRLRWWGIPGSASVTTRVRCGRQ